jgi:hypothetical protein
MAAIFTQKIIGNYGLLPKEARRTFQNSIWDMHWLLDIPNSKSAGLIKSTYQSFGPMAAYFSLKATDKLKGSKI